MKPTLYIIRGLPGSGKSTYAKKEFSGLPNFEADMFFMRNGEYNFNPKLLHRAHKWCFESTVSELEKGNDVVVSNTFTTHKELKQYLNIPGVNFEIHEIYTQFDSIHGVPEEAMERMRRRWFTFPGNFKQAKIIKVK